MKTPEKEPLKKLAEQKGPRQPNSPEEPLHCMGGKHILRITLNTPRITIIAFKGIKVNKMTVRTIYEKTEKLFENLGNILTLAILSYLIEKSLQIRKQSNVSQISDKKVNPARLVRTSLVNSTALIIGLLLLLSLIESVIMNSNPLGYFCSLK